MMKPGTVLIFISVLLTNAVTACEWGKYGENCEQRCPRNCQVNPLRNLTHCNKETGECSDGCQPGWYASQCDQPCSKNCLDKVCSHQNGQCTKGCSGNQIGDFCEITEVLIRTDVKATTDETTGLSTAHVTVIITISLVAIIVIIVVTVVIKRRRQTDNRRKSTGRPTASADPENPEDVPLLRSMLDWEIQKTEELFEETAIYNKVKERLENFRHVTISGASGEGKTSMALKLGSEYQKKGYELYFVNSISEFKLSCERKGKYMCFIFDDIFGTVGILTDSPHFRRILGILNSWLEQMTSDFSKPFQFNGKLNLHSTHIEKNMGNVYVIFTTKSYNLELGKLHLGENEFVFFKGDSVIDLTQTECCYTVEEKKKMFIKHKKYNSNISYFDLDKICGIKDQLFGFPLTCKLFFSFPKSHNKYEDFFKTPLTYLREELESLLRQRNKKSAALILMLLCEGNLNLCHLESGSQALEKHLSTVSSVVSGVDSAEIISCVKGFFGTLFTRRDNTSFSHPAIYDACAFVYCKINCAFVLQHCSMQFLYERVQAQTVPACEADEDRHVIYVSDAYNDIIASRLAGAVREGNYRMSIMHPILERQDIVDTILAELKPFLTDTSVTDEHGNNMFHYACYSGNVYLVRQLIPFCDINSKGADGVTPTGISALHGQEDLLKMLESKGADITLTDDNNDTVLHLACRGGKRSIVEYLLPSFDVNILGQRGQTAVMQAALSTTKDVFDLLVSEGADLTLTDDNKNTVLHLACRGGNRTIVEQLLPSFDINSRGEHGWTALMAAALSAKKDVFDLLVSKGADLTLTDDNKNIVLHHANFGGNRSIVEQLLPSCDINTRGQHGWTALMVAALSAKKVLFDLLVSKGADLTLTDDYSDTVLHLACNGGNRSIVEHLLPMCDINKGWTPVMKGAYSGKKDTLDLLLSKGANPLLTGDDKNALLPAATRGGNIDIVRHVIGDFDINTRGGNGHTPLMQAVCGGHTDVVDFLVDHGADVNMVDNDGDGLLHLACEKGNLKMVKHVMSYSDINLTDNFGWTPLAIAAVEGNYAVFKYLKGLGADVTLEDMAGDDVYTLALQGGCRGIIKELGREEHSGKSITPWNKLMKSLVQSQMFYLKTYSEQSPALVQTDQYGDSLLHLACRGGNKLCVEYLLPSYDINVRGRYHWTPVMMAAVCGHEDVFQLLVSHKADLSLVSNTGEGITNLARRGNNDDIVQYLLEKS